MFLDTLVKNLHHSIFRYDEVLSYLKYREVTEKDIEKFDLGFGKVVTVPDDETSDRQRFMDESWKGRKFENKLIFPIKDPIGRVVGIIGRSIDTKGFKIYVTNEAKFSGFFFGLYEALPCIYEKNRVYIVEGPFDSMAFSKVLPNTVATLTAKLHESQYELLNFYCDNIITVFDSDKAGKDGTEKALKYENVHSMFLGYKDPSKCLEELKLDKFKKFVMDKLQKVPPF